MRGDGGPIGQQGVPTVLRTFVPEAGVRLDDVVRSLDDRARRDGLTVTAHRDGHCAVTGAKEGQVILVWRGDASANEVRFRALYLPGTQPGPDRCTAEAGPPE